MKYKFLNSELESFISQSHLFALVATVNGMDHHFPGFHSTEYLPLLASVWAAVFLLPTSVLFFCRDALWALYLLSPFAHELELITYTSDWHCLFAKIHFWHCSTTVLKRLPGGEYL